MGYLKSISAVLEVKLYFTTLDLIILTITESYMGLSYAIETSSILLFRLILPNIRLPYTRRLLIKGIRSRVVSG